METLIAKGLDIFLMSKLFIHYLSEAAKRVIYILFLNLIIKSLNFHL